jgi:sugar/nucleoside kinase (ribokinase family)
MNEMPILVVGSVALDSVETPFGTAEAVLGGSANFFAAAASLFGKVRMVGVVGNDYPMDRLDFLVERGVDLTGVETRPGPSFFWEGRYDYDLNSRETISTRLGVFADFQPHIPEAFRDAPLVFLGNIDPGLQHDVLDQVTNPRLVACDTMNYWIEGRREELLRLLPRVDVLMVNDAELRQLAGEPNLLLGARWVQALGPDYVVVKKGEHGAILFARDWIFFAPGYPLEEIFDPTGAGDAFAGGFVGYLSGSDELSREELRRAMVYGSAAGSYAVESFSVDRFRTLTPLEMAHRVEEFREMTFFEHELEVHARG